jgi:hypothetical protein
MNAKNQFSQVLADLEVDSSDMMDNPKAFITRVITKSKELSAQLDARSTIGESEKRFKESALKNKDAQEKAKEIFDNIYDVVSEQEPDVLVNIMALMPDLIQLMNSSVRSMSMRSGNVTSLSKRQINLLYIKLKNTYETYIQFMKLFQPDKIGIPPVIPPKKGNFSDHTATMGIKTFEFVIDGEPWINPFAVAKELGLKIEFYMDLPEMIEKLGPEINGHTVTLNDISKDKDES